MEKTGSADITLEMVQDIKRKEKTPWELVGHQPVYRCPVCGEHNAYESHVMFSGKMKCKWCACPFTQEGKSKEPEW